MLEKEIQLAICDYLAYKHYFFWRQNVMPIYDKDHFRAMPKYSKNGLPDIFLIKDGQFIGIEVKRPKGKQSENQIIFERECKQNGGKYHVVTSLDDIVALGL